MVCVKSPNQGSWWYACLFCPVVRSRSIELQYLCTMNCHDPSGADRTVRQGPPKCGILADMQVGSAGIGGVRYGHGTVRNGLLLVGESRLRPG